jgi:hypothetical protein
MSKLLITGGCSFSECVSFSQHTWPIQLSKILHPDWQHKPTGMGSQGNGLISRRIIYQVMEELKTTNPEDMLVGIMWSGPDRHDLYHTENIYFDVHEAWLENPTKFVKNTPGHWIILNGGWRSSYARNYYTNFHEHVGSLIYTIEHMLRVQWFLKQHNIKYFMTTYTAEVLPDIVKSHPEVEYLYKQIDFDKFLPVTGEYEWCAEHMPNDFPRPNDNHPGIEQHTAFTEQVIIPFLKEKQYI